MSGYVFPLIVIASLASALPAHSQDSAKKMFGSRELHTCPSRKEGLSPAQAKRYFQCDAELVDCPNASGTSIWLVSDATIELGKPRPYNGMDGVYAPDQIDPSQSVYDIRGSFTSWRCYKLGEMFGEPGKNCIRYPQPKATGECFKNSFGDWHCKMQDRVTKGDFVAKYPPPVQP